MLPTRDVLYIVLKAHINWESIKRCKKVFQTNGNSKIIKAGVPIVISDKIKFKRGGKDQEGSYITVKKSIYQQIYI